jgi:hypothetical protein
MVGDSARDVNTKMSMGEKFLIYGEIKGGVARTNWFPVAVVATMVSPIASISETLTTLPQECAMVIPAPARRIFQLYKVFMSAP